MRITEIVSYMGNILNDLVKPWESKYDIIVCVKKYFYSVESSLEINHIGFRFIDMMNKSQK